MSLLAIIDFETRSRVDIKTAGSDLYAQDPSTDILCMGAVFSDDDDNRKFLWYPERYGLNGIGSISHFFLALRKHIDEGGLVAAHNARFDQHIWECIAVNEYGFPELRLNDWYCTAAQARVNALPASLDRATQALDTKFRKSKNEGLRLIQYLSIPDKSNGEFREDLRKLEEMGSTKIGWPTSV